MTGPTGGLPPADSRDDAAPHPSPRRAATRPAGPQPIHLGQPEFVPLDPSSEHRARLALADLLAPLVAAARAERADRQRPHPG